MLLSVMSVNLSVKVCTAQIKMYSIDGQLMVEKTCKINDNAIIIENLSAFANGIYYVSIFIDGQMHCLKVNKI